MPEQRCADKAGRGMDWARAIEINQTALSRIVAALIAMVGFQAEGALRRLPRPLYRAALRVLRPAESAVRRLIVIAARGLVVKPHATRPMPAGLELRERGGAPGFFQPFDRRQRVSIPRPRRLPPARPRRTPVGGGPPPPPF